MSQLIKVKEVTAMTGLSRSGIRRMYIAGHFPKPIRIGNSSVWKRTIVQDFIDDITALDAEYIEYRIAELTKLLKGVK